MLTEQTVDFLIERIRGKTQREVEEIASAFRTPIRLRDRVQRVNVPARAAPAEQTKVLSVEPRGESAPGALLVDPVANSQSGSEKSPTAVNTVSKLYIQFLADDAFMRDYNQACALLSHKIPKPSFAEVFGVLLRDFVNRHSPKERQQRRDRRGVEVEARTTKRPNGTTSSRPAIPAKTRDAVFVRDQGRCTYVGTNGRRCNATHGLHIDHITPVARNGTNDTKNLRLLCAQHNQLEAERILGEGPMRRYRQPGR